MSALLGFSTTSDAGAVLFTPGTLECAVNEERLNRVKLFGGIPEKSIREVQELSGFSGESVSLIALSSHHRGFPPFSRYLERISFHHPSSLPLLLARGAYISYERASQYAAMRNTASQQFGKAKILNYDHHLSHAASAFFTSGHKSALAVTEDGWGDAQSNGAYACNGETISLLHSSSEIDSVGYLYGRVTVALGFKFHRHEGKVSGLAAYGSPDPGLVQRFKRMVWFSPKRMGFESIIGGGYAPFGNHFLDGLKRLLKPYSRETVAASVQCWVEDINRAYFTALMEEHGSQDVVLAGGVFANVALNKVVHETPGVKSVYIFPHMGDGGLGMGAGLLAHNQELQAYNERFQNLYLGPSFTVGEMETALQQAKVPYEKLPGIEHAIAELLAKGKVVARFNGRMEYGPRALGNRSILYQPTDPSVNDWLNRRLNRTEFMPFAPSTLSDHASKCYTGIKGAEYAAQFMTITFNCTPWMKETAPAVVHLDNTARPQLVTREANPSYYAIIDEYRKITGIPSVVNTSFNVHEEPIVCTPKDAILAFRQSNLDYLAMGPFLVKGGSRNGR